MKKLIVILASFLFILGLSTVSMATPFQNGSFEDGPDDIGAFITLPAGSADITGWTVVSGSIDLIGSYWDAFDGDRSIDLNGNEPGAISQVFDTEPGALYQVFFDVAGNPDDPGLKVLVASANSMATEYEFDSTGKTRTEMGWTEMSFIFQASSDSTTLEFASISPPDSAFGPALDNVRVRPFPEDTMHPAGAVHAHDNLLWPPNNKKVQVEIEGYVIDELSMVRDGAGIGVSQAYLLVNGTEIVLRDETTNLLDPDDGSFSIVEYLEARKNAIYPIELFAADTVAEEDGGPNFGLVDSTFVRVPHDMSGKSKDKDSKEKKKSKKNK
ncbi:MAG: choice-of-anchor C family protein [Deltaproteobacteria bacterium]|nr:choice-of-anchor C family protein [Deltaproteobacteria bacterium]